MRYLLFSGSLLFFTSLAAQLPEPFLSSRKKPKQGSLYFTFGWHRIYYTRSTIHFKDTETGNYDFELVKARAKDDNDLNIRDGEDAPQFSFRFGYIFNRSKGLGIEFNFDHAKYLVVQGQKVRVKGMINDVFYEQDTLLNRSFVKYEHTDGANYYLLNFVKNKDLWQSKNGRHSLGWIIKPGAGLVIPRTQSRILGKSRDDKYHVAGYLFAAESGLRYVFFKHGIAEITCKGAYANYNDVLLYGEGRASQQWWSFQYLFIVGFQFNAGKR
jgi:hypothetical protein